MRQLADLLCVLSVSLGQLRAQLQQLLAIIPPHGWLIPRSSAEKYFPKLLDERLTVQLSIKHWFSVVGSVKDIKWEINEVIVIVIVIVSLLELVDIWMTVRLKIADQIPIKNKMKVLEQTELILLTELINL